MKKMIPIARPFMGKEECSAATKAIMSGWVTQGPMVKRFEDEFAAYVGSSHACAVSSCTTALHLALLAVGVKPGNVVITASHSFIATANSVRHCMAEPVFVDIKPGTFNMSPELIGELLENRCVKRNGKIFYKMDKKMARGESPLAFIDKHNKEYGRVGAILAVHQIGMPCDLRSILSIARKFNIPVVEDAACAIGSEISMRNGAWEKIGRPHGDIACFSFHPRKVMTTGDGGMLTTNNRRYDQRFRLLRQHGMNMSDRARHLSKKVSVESYLTTGYNYRMTDIQAAVGIEQLKRLADIVSSRRALADLYNKELGVIPWLRLPAEPDYCRSNWQSYALRILDNAPLSRDRLMQYLLENGVSSRCGVMNAHKEKPYSNNSVILKNSESARRSVILLPLFYGMTLKQANKVINLIKKNA
ncbi:MAG: DegT/DnrJ/EryC1/StrS family aminotransferase [Candidatus Omnitrophota bacterium]